MCISELRGLGDVSRRLKDAGGAVIAVSADSQAESKKVVERYKIPFDLLSDEGAKVIKQYGLLFHEPMGRGEIALPANFLIDRRGKVAWRYISTHVQMRVDPAETLAEVEKLLKQAGGSENRSRP